MRARPATLTLATIVVAAGFGFGSAARADETAVARLGWECESMASVLLDSVRSMKVAADQLVVIGTGDELRQRLSLNDALLRSLVRGEMASSTMVRLGCPHRRIVAEFDEQLRRGWALLAAHRRAFLRLILAP